MPPYTMEQQNATYYRWLYLMIGAAILVNFSALFVTIIGPDGTYYANIAKTMVLRHNYIDLYVQGKDFLDKPHFPFWVTALFFEWFGFTTWAYKLPGILFLMMGAGYTYLFAKALYNRQIALWSVLILLTAQHIMISDNDVRAEPYLTGMIIASVYHFYKAYINNNYWQLLSGCLFAALAIMTKGMFAIIPICGAIGGHLIITKQWWALLHWRWLLAGVLILICILPEIYCLYEQFDTHPEKLIFERHNVSGIKFFFWDSQFGRFFNTGPIKGSGDPFFFVHTLLWAFLPWSLLLFAAIYQFIKKGRKQVQAQQWYCLCGGLLTFLVFSASKFQLPYYLNIVFPFFAITVAQYIDTVRSVKSLKAIVIIQDVVCFLMVLLIIALMWFFADHIPMVIIGWLVIGRLLLFSLKKRSLRLKLVLCSCLAAMFVNIILNTAFYPSLLHYQAGSEAAFWLNQNNPQKLTVVQTGDAYSFPLEFYLNQPLVTIDPNGNGPTPPRPFYLYGDVNIINNLAKIAHWQIEPQQTFKMYWISMLKPAFLNKNTRPNTLTINQVVLVR